MTRDDVSILYRFLGVVDGIMDSLPDGAKDLLDGYLDVIGDILDREVKKGLDSNG